MRFGGRETVDLQAQLGGQGSGSTPEWSYGMHESHYKDDGEQVKLVS